MALYLGFYLDMHLAGFWIGYIIAMFLVDVVVIILVVISDWEPKHIEEAETEEARSRAASQNSAAMQRRGSH